MDTRAGHIGARDARDEDTGTGDAGAKATRARHIGARDTTDDDTMLGDTEAKDVITISSGDARDRDTIADGEVSNASSRKKWNDILAPRILYHLRITASVGLWKADYTQVYLFAKYFDLGTFTY